MATWRSTSTAEASASSPPYTSFTSSRHTKARNSPAPSGEGPLYHHIGIYAYRRSALSRFVALSPSPLEKREKLEQLRALENSMTIGVARVDTSPLGVDTQAELDRARAIYAATTKR